MGKVMGKDKENKIIDRNHAIAVKDTAYIAGPIVTVGPFDEFVYALVNYTKDEKKTKQKLNEVVDTFELCLPSSIKRNLGVTGRIFSL